MSEMQKRTLEALQAVQSMQRTSLEASRRYAQELSRTATPVPTPASMRSVTDLTATYAFRMLETQLAYARRVTEIFAPRAGANAAVATPDSARPVALAASAPPALAALEGTLLDVAVAPAVVADSVAVEQALSTDAADPDDAATATLVAETATAQGPIDWSPRLTVETISGDVVERTMAKPPTTGITASPKPPSPRTSNQRATPKKKPRKK